jgi:hypothetical protein
MAIEVEEGEEMGIEDRRESGMEGGKVVVILLRRMGHAARNVRGRGHRTGRDHRKRGEMVNGKAQEEQEEHLPLDLEVREEGNLSMALETRQQRMGLQQTRKRSQHRQKCCWMATATPKMQRFDA